MMIVYVVNFVLLFSGLVNMNSTGNTFIIFSVDFQKLFIINIGYVFFSNPSNYLSVYHDKDPLFNIIPVTKFLENVI